MDRQGVAEAIDHTERMKISADINLGNLGKLVKESQQTPAVADSKESLPTTPPKTVLHLLVNPTQGDHSGALQRLHCSALSLGSRPFAQVGLLVLSTFFSIPERN